MGNKILKYEDRMAICRECEYFHSRAATCGTPVIGNHVVHDGKDVKLCGCFLHFKARIPAMSCPLDKWAGHITEDQRADLIRFLTEAQSTGVADIQTVAKWWNLTHPDEAKRATSCPPCNKAIIESLWRDFRDKRPKLDAIDN